MTQSYVDRQTSMRRSLLALLVALLGLLVIGGAWLYVAEQAVVRQRVEQDLMTIEKLKVQEIGRWRADRLGEIQALSASPTLRDGMSMLAAGAPSSESSAAVVWLGSVSEHLGYTGILVLDADSRAVGSAGAAALAVDQTTIDLSKQAMETNTAVLTDLHEDPVGSRIHMGVIAPVRATEDDEPVGAIVAFIDPDAFLYPLIQSWPTESETAETLLVERSGEEAIFLNDLRHVDGAALSLTVPPERSDIPAIMAIEGQTGIVDGVDYRDVPVIAAIEPIPDSPWYMIAKIDRQEAFAAWRARAWLILGVLFSLALLIVMTVGLMWQRARSAELRAILESERAQRESEARYQTTLLSVGDGVIVADANGAVLLLNPVAENLTGWSLEEAKGLPIDDVFQVVSERTGERISRPVSAVLGTGRTSSLPEASMLIARDGSKRPVADSSAPVRDADGTIVGMVLVFRDQTEERAAQREIAEAMERLESAEAHAVLGSWEYSLQGGDGWWSAQMYTLTQHNPRAGVPSMQEFLASVHPDERDHVRKRLFEPAEHTPEHVEFRLLAPDGSQRWMSGSSRVERVERGSVTAIAGTMLDVTRFHEAQVEIMQLNRSLEMRVQERTVELQAATEELRNTNEELLSLNEELQCSAEEIATINEDLIEASEAKTNFLRAMSHELRTPLNSIIGFSDILSQGMVGPLNVEQRKQLEMINHSGNHLLALINDILDLSRVEAGKIELVNEPIDVGLMVDDVIESVSGTALSKGLDLTVSLPEDGDVRLVSDRRRIQQVLINLLGNAVKFTERGSVKLVVAQPASGLISFSVVDTGPGISPADQERIFGEFAQVSDDAAVREGTGLGLAISRGLAQALGGSLTVTSRVGKGSTFMLVLPHDRQS